MSGVRQFDEAFILPLVLDIFWRNGWQATSLVEIAKETGVQRGSLYNAYGGKDELFLQAYEIYCKNFLNNIDLAMKGDSLQEVLTNFFSAALANMSKGTPAKGCLTTKMLVDINLTSERIQQRLRDFMNELRLALEVKLSDPKWKDSLILEVGQTADVLITYTRGIAVMERAYKDPTFLQNTCDAFVQILVKK
ncbi:TetR/AcrR family transcriptional regulator [Acinetobacter gyllenbergii]|uniref:TetR/AcrR family transcriptional regulator n=1 Tax=Acinetobacter gyllenbergii TaxID=134534 RepID=UPI000806A663|nr:TetR/AcrR family transcriptional regulator [Acinetobacter gyllenbergii]MCU4580228.1 TetR/AcrR family transcriptional regulator [Acinetobacter gyllenbergii]OBY73230.1 TetR family transcriptional regulator [Acinetobacter gyllenbergii]